jgi:hypothetical protein
MPSSYLKIQYRLQELTLPNTRSRRYWESNTFVIFFNFFSVHIVIVVVWIVTKQSGRWPPQDWRNVLSASSVGILKMKTACSLKVYYPHIRPHGQNADDHSMEIVYYGLICGKTGDISPPSVHSGL